MPVVSAGDMELFYRESGQGEPVLFIQGLGVDHRGWAGVASRLATGYRCITYDNRDIGRSSLVEAPYGVMEMTGDALALLDALGIERAHVVGVSMGGVIAQEMAIRHPERVHRLALVSTYTSSDPRGVTIFEGQAMLRRTLSKEDYCRATFWSVYSHQDYRREGFVEDMIRRTVANDLWQPQEAYERHVRAVLSCDTEGRLHEIKAPTLILEGAEDILTPPRFSMLLAREVPDNRFVMIEGAGHGLIWSHPEIVAEHLASFLG